MNSDVLILPFDSDYTDSSPSEHIITPVGGVSIDNLEYKFGGSSAYFNGSGLLRAPSSPDFDVSTGDYTIQLWVNPDSDSGNGTLLTYGGPSHNWGDTGMNWYLIRLSDGTSFFEWKVSGGSAWSGIISTLIPSDTWTHVRVCISGTTAYYFIGGLLVWSGSIAGIQTITEPQYLRIGQNAAGANSLKGNLDDIVLIKGAALSTDDYQPPLVPYGSLEQKERVLPMVLSSITEQNIGLNVPVAGNLERAQQLSITPSRRAERALNLLIDISTLYERVLRLPITGYIGREAFQRLRISGALAQLEQYKEFAIEDFDRVYCEAFQRFSIYAGLAGLVKEIGVTLFINGSAIPFETGSGGDSEGVYFKVYEFTAPYDDLIRSLPDPTKSRPTAQIAWASEIKTEGGSQIVFDWVIELILDSITVSRVTDQTTRHTSETATIRLVSPTAALGWLDGNLGAAPITESWPSGTMATAILDDIFPDSLSYDLQIADFPIGQQLDVDELYPNEIIPLFLTECVIHTANDDTLIIRNRPEVRGTVTPVHDLSPPDYEMSAVDNDDQGQYRPNVVRVANFQEADAAQTLSAPEIVVDDDDPRKATVYAYPVPFRQVWLRTSRVPATGFTQNSGLPQTVEAGDGQGELVEFLEGQASTSRPITGGFDSIDYGDNADLGTVTPNEDGTLTAAIKSRSMGVAKYSTKRYAFEISLAGAISSVSGGDGSTTVQDSLGNSIQLWFVDQEDL